MSVCLKGVYFLSGCLFRRDEFKAINSTYNRPCHIPHVLKFLLVSFNSWLTTAKEPPLLNCTELLPQHDPSIIVNLIFWAHVLASSKRGFKASSLFWDGCSFKWSHLMSTRTWMVFMVVDFPANPIATRTLLSTDHNLNFPKIVKPIVFSEGWARLKRWKDGGLLCRIQ